MDDVWLLTDMRSDKFVEHVFTAEHLAMHAAEKLVGNRAVAGDAEIMLYGPGDGTVSVMIRKLPRELAVEMDLCVPIG